MIFLLRLQRLSLTWFCPLGDEILAINGKPLHGSSHKEAILAFKEIKQGKVVLHIGRRRKKKAVAHQ